MSRLINLLGHRFGKLLVAERGKNAGARGNKPTWICLCDCGHKTTVFGADLRSGHTRSCGCALSRGKPTADRFWPRVNKTDGCWLWTGPITKQGYGEGICLASMDGRRIQSHRVAWILTHGAIPNGMHVLHKCDNPTCVNPSHLFLGTNQDNVDDKMNKGRFVPVCGESHPKSKLTEADVLAIRGSLLPTGVLSKQYGVSTSLVLRIKKRKTWAHI